MARQRAEVARRPVEVNQSHQIFDEAGCLPQRHPRQYLHRKACLDSGVAVALMATTLACRRGMPGHPGVKPDRQRTPAL